MRVRPTSCPRDSRAHLLLPAIILVAAALMPGGGSAAPPGEAAGQGWPTTMSHLGWIYEQGHGVAVDGERAAHWYGRAARAGAYDYAMKLGWMYLGGQGVAQDRAQADDWFGFAIEAGPVPAHLEAVLSPEQGQAARELAVRWALEHR